MKNIAHLRSCHSYPRPVYARLKVVKLALPVRKRSICIECKEDRGYTAPMLKDEVWLQVANKKELLCFECLETRLGRNITIEDLNHANINYAFHKIYERAFHTSKVVS